MYQHINRLNQKGRKIRVWRTYYSMQNALRKVGFVLNTGMCN